MTDVATLRTRLDDLRAMRAEGTREMSFNGRRVVYRTDAELAAAIADLERQVATAENRPPVRSFTLNYRKGTI